MAINFYANGKKTNAKKKGNGRVKKRVGNVTRLNNEKYHTETIKGYISHTSTVNHKCISTIPCAPGGVDNVTVASNGTTYPQWNALAAKYSEFRVIYASATIIFKNHDSCVMSLVERDPTVIDDKTVMVKDTQFKTHSLDANQLSVFRAWAPSASADYDFTPTDLTGRCPAYIKLLQDDINLATADFKPKCEVVLTLKCQFRNLKNA